MSPSVKPLTCTLLRNTVRAIVFECVDLSSKSPQKDVENAKSQNYNNEDAISRSLQRESTMMKTWFQSDLRRYMAGRVGGVNRLFTDMSVSHIHIHHTTSATAIDSSTARQNNTKKGENVIIPDNTSEQSSRQFSDCQGAAPICLESLSEC